MVVLVQRNETKILNDSRVRLSRIDWRLREFLNNLLPPSFVLANNQRVHLFEKHPPALNISFHHGEYPMGADLSELECTVRTLLPSPGPLGGILCSRSWSWASAFSPRVPNIFAELLSWPSSVQRLMVLIMLSIYLIILLPNSSIGGNGEAPGSSSGSLSNFHSSLTRDSVKPKKSRVPREVRIKGIL